MAAHAHAMIQPRPSPATLCEALRDAARSDRDVVIVGHGDQEQRRSYRDLLAGSLRRAAGLRALGLARGERVVVVLNTSFEFIETFFGVMFAGGVAVPAYPPVAMSRLDSYLDLLAHIVDQTRARFIVSDATIGKTLGTLYRRCEQLEEILEVADLADDPARWTERAPDAEAPAFIQCTSGSTSAPKGVVLLHCNLLANIAGIAGSMEVSPDRDVLVSWLPLYHDLGLIGALLTAITTRAKLVLLPPDVFLLDAAAWWRAVARHGGTITAAPNFAFGLCTRRLGEEELAGLDLSRVRIVLSGAEPIQPRVIDRFFDKLAPAGLDRRAFYPAYGLAESCVAVTMSRPGRGLRVDRIARAALAARAAPRAIPAIGAAERVEVVSVGRAIASSALRIRDGEGHALPERCVGEVCVRGPSVMSGYLDNPEATAEAIREGELRTGDLGYLAGGELFIVGRIKHMLIVRGKNYFAEDIEAAVEQVPGVRKGNAVAFGVGDERRGEQLQLVVETRLRRDEERRELEQRIGEAVAEAVGLTPRAIVLVPANTLPKTSSGKKRRGRCREMVASGEIVAGTRRKRASSGVGTLVRSQLAFAGHKLRKSFGASAPLRLSTSS